MLPACLIQRTVEIPIIRRRCCAVEFNSTYPIQLEGIIEQTEFEESIQNINQTITQRDSLIMIDLLPEICLLIGLILIIAGVIIFMFFILPIVLLVIALACCIFVLGLILMIFGYYMIHGDLSEQMQQAITRESTKYSTRTPTPCTWRLHLRRMNAGNLENYGIIIDIGCQIIPQVPSRSRRARQQVSSPLQANDTPPPPPYNSHKAIKFCSQCGMPKQNSTARFCASCGQSLGV